MHIGYFATNRSLTDLGRSVSSREDRIQLRRGGYYFIDMDRYMAHYLGEVDTETVPKEAVLSGKSEDGIKKSQDVIFDKFLRNERVERIVVCVHGYNVELFEACSWFRILTDTIRHLPDIGGRIVTCPSDIQQTGVKDEPLTAFIGFSWPSDGKVFGYISDQKEAFGNLLVRLRALGKPVSLICHSMGNYMACHTLKGLVNEEFVPIEVDRNIEHLLTRGDKEEETEEVRRSDWLIDVFVMLAPDVERRHITKSGGRGVESSYVGPFFSGLQHLVRQNVNVYSRYDNMLAISNIEKSARGVVGSVSELLGFRERNPDYKWEHRLGEAPHPVNAPPNFVSINAVELTGRPIDHSDHIDAVEIVQRIATILQI